MRILHVTPGINPASGGPTRSVKGLCRGLAKAGVDVSLLVMREQQEFENPCGVKVIYGMQNLKGGFAAYDLVHFHGLWDLDLHRAIVRCRAEKVRYLISPRGMLDPWALSVKKWKKRLGMFLYQGQDLKRAAAFHVTAELEVTSVRRAGFSQPCIISPNGVDVPDERMFECSECSNALVGEGRTAIFLSRLHPGKGLLLLAEAWARVRPQGWRMLVVGPDVCGHKAEVLAKLDAFGISYVDATACTQSNIRTFEQSNNSSWQFVDMVDDVAKWKYYRSADLLVHPSVSENFGITIAEGLAAGLPVICTDGTPWTDVRDFKCGWYIKANSIDALTAALQEATASSNLDEMGSRGRKLVEDRYSWAAACDKMVRGYKEIVRG